MLEEKFAQLKNSTYILEQNSSLVITKLDEFCSLGVTYKTFYIRVCNAREGATKDKSTLSEQKEIVIIDFQTTFTSYLPFNMKSTDIKNIELDIAMNIFLIKIIDSGFIKKVFIFKISQISAQEKKQDQLKLVSRTSLRLDMVNSLNVKANAMTIVRYAQDLRTIIGSNVSWRTDIYVNEYQIKLLFLKCESSKCELAERFQYYKIFSRNKYGESEPQISNSELSEVKSEINYVSIEDEEESTAKEFESKM